MTNIDYGPILKRSKQIVFKNKWLWVYGLVLAATGSGGSSNSFSSPSGSTPADKQELNNLPTDIPEKAKEVLGTTISAVSSWMASVPPGKWVLLGVGILGLVLLSVGFSVFVRNWASAALITGADDADQDKPVSLTETAKKGLTKTVALIIFGVKIGLLVFGITLGLILLFWLGFMAFSNSTVGKVIWAILAGGLGILLFFATVLLASMASVFAERLIVLHGYGHTQAFGKSFSLAKGNFLSAAVMGIINSAVGCGVGCVSSLIAAIVLAIPAIIVLLPVIGGGISALNVPMLIVLAILLFIFIQMNILVHSGLIVFNYSNWNIFVKEILKQEEKL